MDKNSSINKNNLNEDDCYYCWNTVDDNYWKTHNKYHYKNINKDVKICAIITPDNKNPNPMLFYYNGKVQNYLYIDYCSNRHKQSYLYKGKGIWDDEII
jgi:hypothetical protein